MMEAATQATTLVKLALDEYELGVATSGETFGVPRSGPRVARMLRGGPKSLRAELAAAYLQRFHKTAGSGALADAMLVLEGQAQAVAPTELALRTVHSAGTIVVDLGTVAGWCVEID